MTAEQLVAVLQWYLEHLHVILAGAAVFDLVCWVIIGTIVYRKRRRGLTSPH